MSKIEEKGSSYEDRENALQEKWIREGRTRIHYCPDWDFMLICSDLPEYEACCCDRGLSPLPSETTETEVEIFSEPDAPARLGTEFLE